MNKYIITFRVLSKYCEFGPHGEKCCENPYVPGMPLGQLFRCNEKDCPALKGLKKAEGYP